MGKITSCLAVAALSLTRPSLAAEFFVSPTGQNTGHGSIDRPWDLQTALRQPASVKPGDTIWLRGGTYTGHFVSTLRGDERRPIMVRPYAGERATLDGNDGTNEVTLLVKGSDTWFWGFEVTNSNTTRISSGTGPIPGRGEAVNLLGARTRAINMVLHDTNQGVLTTTDIPNTEVTGCLIYYNGYDGTDRGHGHGIYIQNAAPSTKQVFDNIIFGQFGIGVHAYTESGKLEGLTFDGNTSFNNGMLSRVSGPTTDILIGASGTPATDARSSNKVARNTILRNNYTYFPQSGTAINLGYSKGIVSPTIVNNYFVGGDALALVNAFRPITMTGNTVYGQISGFQASEFPGNTYTTVRPTGTLVYVRPNRYEQGRANITIYNWDRAPSVDVSLQGVIAPGTHYELRDAQNYFGPPVLSGVYAGLPLQVPMAALVPAAPVGLAAPPPTGPDFQVFVLVPTNSVETPRNRPTRPPGPAFAAPAVRPLSPRSLAHAPAALAGEAGGAAVSSRLSVEPCPASFLVHSADPASPSESLPARYVLNAASSASLAACRTALTLGNHGAEVATVTLTFLAAESDNTSAPSVMKVLAPGEDLFLRDAVHDLFGLEEVRGVLEIATDAPDQVAAELDGASGTPPREPARAALSRRTTLRTPDPASAAPYDVLVLNPRAAEATIALTLAGSADSPPEMVFTVVPPHGFLRRGVEHLFPSFSSRAGEPLSIDVDAGSDAVLALSLARNAPAAAAVRASPREP